MTKYVKNQMETMYKCTWPGHFIFEIIFKQILVPQRMMPKFLAIIYMPDKFWESSFDITFKQILVPQRLMSSKFLTISLKNLESPKAVTEGIGGM